MFCGEHRSFRRAVLALEIVTDILHLNPFDAWFGANVFNQPGEVNMDTGIRAAKWALSAWAVAYLSSMKITCG